MNATGTAPASQRTILAVDDDPVQALLYQHVLDRPEWRVLVAPTLADATRALESNDIDIVLLDLFLPDGDGRDWLFALRARPGHGNTPVIVVAGSAVMQAQIDCYELGADTMLAKPIEPRVLLAAVTGALQRSAPRQERRHHAEPGEQVTNAAPTPRAGARPRALLAEDDDVVALLVEHRLANDGYDVHRYRDGVAALEAATATPFSVAILDVLMPGMDGLELLTAIRRDPALRQLPVVMLTGLGSERDVERALAMGANDYVLKPFSPLELAARVNRLLARRTAG